MTHEFSQEERERIIFQLAEALGFSSDEYLTRLLEDVSADYARGYLDAFLANAPAEEILLFYQFVKLTRMA